MTDAIGITPKWQMQLELHLLLVVDLQGMSSKKISSNGTGQ